MKTDTKRTVEKPKKQRTYKILRTIRRLGSYHFHIKVPLDQGPKFSNRTLTVEWQKGWKNAKAYEQGYQAGLGGEGANKNPHLRKIRDVKSKKNAESRQWENARQAAAELVKIYCL